MTGADYSKVIYLIIIGLFAAFTGIISIKSLRKLHKLKDGTTCNGKIADKKIVSDEGNSYFVTYNFRDYLGQEHNEEIQVSKKYYESVEKEQVVHIVYQTNNSKNSYIANSALQKYFYWQAICFLLVTIVLVYVAYAFINDCVMLNKC